uniref:Uncharacterized protein n=1 Tax=Hanusia phi TaxID=3032 RepID=A0A7S0E7G1_9CRYP|mmetsp:Transcript_18315/g.41691  ORF Transcript_18315/g.41691 Transcript_18315/m.41691 type:complete len:145 (+) Transcript_18315:522-956(+)
MAALLILGDNVRHVLQDLDVWPAGPWPGSSQYVSNCPARIAMSPPRPCNTSAECGTFDCGGDSYAASDGASCFSCYVGEGSFDHTCSNGMESISCLSAVGWIFLSMTYSGFALFFIATFWNADLVGKLRRIQEQWKAIREDDGI